MRAPGALAVWSALRWHGGALISGLVVASQRQGAAGKHQWDPGVASGKEEGAEAHQRGGSTAREEESGGSLTFRGGGKI
jgi:hypothetical protein